MMDEWVDVLDENGKHTGQSVLKAEAHRFGLFHPTVHIWFYTDDAQILFQKRSVLKKTFPGLWDVSVAGHISAGEEVRYSAIREAKEELGIKLKVTELKKIGTHKHISRHGEIIDCEFNHIFISRLKKPIHKLKLQESEVDAVKLLPLQTLLGPLNPTEFVVLDAEYYKKLYLAIKSTVKA